MTEFFGPVLSILPAKDLDEAIDMVNATGYGLTSSLESLDGREQDHWQKRVKAGNLYVNRGTTGAMVLRQPFGGMGKSALGAGIKVGGPNYLVQFMAFDEVGFPRTGPVSRESPLLQIIQEWEIKLVWGRLKAWRTDLEKTVFGVRSCLYWMEEAFSREKDYFKLRGEDNIFRYLPYDRVVVRVHEQDTLFEVLTRVAAARDPLPRRRISEYHRRCPVPGRPGATGTDGRGPHRDCFADARSSAMPQPTACPQRFMRRQPKKDVTFRATRCSWKAG